MNTATPTSPYWLSPGIDIPTNDDMDPNSTLLEGFYVTADTGEAGFVPTAAFMRETPLWCLDVLGDIASSVEQTRRHALVGWFRECQDQQPGVPFKRALSAFRQICKETGIAVPFDLETLLRRDLQFRQSAM